MNRALAQRQLALAGIALLAGIVSLGVSSREQSSGPKLPASIPAPDGGWFPALATAGGATFARTHVDKACGHEVGPSSRVGVANPVLPCDTRIYIQFGDVEVYTQVVARTPKSAEADFELAPGLARQIGLAGTEPVGWRYAR